MIAGNVFGVGGGDGCCVSLWEVYVSVAALFIGSNGSSRPVYLSRSIHQYHAGEMERT
jgi:hypothetical protein